MITNKKLVFIISFMVMTNAYANGPSNQGVSANINTCEVKYDLEINLENENDVQSIDQNSDQNNDITYTLTRKDELSTNGEVKERKIVLKDPDGSEYLLALKLKAENLSDSELIEFKELVIAKLEKFIAHWQALAASNPQVASAIEEARKLLAEIRDGNFNKEILNDIAQDVIKPVDIAVAEMLREGKDEELAQFEGAQKPIFNHDIKPVDNNKDVNSSRLYSGIKNVAVNSENISCVPFAIVENDEQNVAQDQVETLESSDQEQAVSSDTAYGVQ